jgi:phosphoenolpyruvate carboxykinase (ATP)
MIAAALAGELDRVRYSRHPMFNVEVPSECPGVPDKVLDPRDTWPNPRDYDEQAKMLARMFADNFKAFEQDASPSVKAAGPGV